jgi:signal transduction histidine kinase
MNQLLENKVQERTLELESTLKKLRELEFQLFQSTKMATLGQLSAGIAHEINNPIAYIYNNTFIIKRNLQKIFEVLNAVHTALREHSPAATSTEQLRNLEQIISEVDLNLKKQVIEDAVTKNESGLERIQMIIESLKNFTRTNNAELKIESLHNCIEAALEILQPQIRGNIQIIKSYQSLPPIRCYANLLIQVFINLISNAIQAIQREGQIFIRTSVGPNEQVVEIEDTGCGIPAANLEKIFDPLFTTKEQGHGMGLGLSICKGIIEKHHGTISVKSTVARGSLFNITLPQNNAEEGT